MSFFNDEQKLTKHFLDGWDNSDYSSLPVDMVGKKNGPNEHGEIIRFRIRRAPSLPFAIGPSRRNFGSVMVQFVRRSGDGAADITKMADEVAEIFAPNHKPVRIGGIRCRTPSAMGPEENEGLVTMSVDIPFLSDYSA